jgi:hypothetical protein
LALSKKIKTGLDETRMLILGAQILLGFQFSAVFGELFEQLSETARYGSAIGIGLMTCVVALLITPGTYHRIVLSGRDDPSFQPIINFVAETALLPFAVALGIDVFMAGEQVFGSLIGVTIGVSAAVIALLGWYAWPYASRPATRKAQPRMKAYRTPLEVRIEQMLTEARVVLPGAQALFGFQLSIVVTRAFSQLPDNLRSVHAVSLCLVALAVMLLMAPAAYHRIVFDGDDTEQMHRVGSAMLTAATIPLAAGLAGDVYVVMQVIQKSPMLAAASGVAALVLLFGLWHGFPLVARYLRPTRQG